ncbi:MAG: aminoacyl-tRNA hydrolase [Clostridia bacterium]|nr:aminoacyl-tRNA hydrolase [Clostridia bacterium]
MKTFLVVGLGNPEGKYFETWHNLGFKAAERFAGTEPFTKKGNQMLATAHENDNKIIILKPLTYMNLSGQAVVAVSRKHKIPPEQIIVFVDDIYLDIGTVRLKKSGSAGGHNGLKSVSELLQATNYVKIKIGAKPQTDIKGNTANYVLSKIPDEVRPTLDTAINQAVAIAHDVIAGVK